MTWDHRRHYHPPTPRPHPMPRANRRVPIHPWTIDTHSVNRRLPISSRTIVLRRNRRRVLPHSNRRRPSRTGRLLNSFVILMPDPCHHHRNERHPVRRSPIGQPAETFRSLRPTPHGMRPSETVVEARVVPPPKMISNLSIRRRFEGNEPVQNPRRPFVRPKPRRTAT
jgi:hypothetical protein